jgi:hypothetical protein
MDRVDWGKGLFYAFGLAEGGGLVSGATFSTLQIVAILAFLLLILPFSVGSLVARFGLVYGLVLGIMPAIFALSDLPTEFLGLSRVTGAVILFFAYVVLAGLCGFAGQRVPLWHDAA